MAWRKGQLGFSMTGNASEVLEACEHVETPHDVVAEQESKRAARAFADELEVFNYYQNTQLMEVGYDERETSDEDIWQ